ncbi:hypothetical protein GCM10020367_40570 [Streptomyces sannanensis]|uniref:Uncharacterized protein n=1 Tax=Streptomyces sannanensis TaxID=285536 RepID=A0ABP6SF14_9ACTN
MIRAIRFTPPGEARIRATGVRSRHPAGPDSRTAKQLRSSPGVMRARPAVVARAARRDVMTYWSDAADA